MSQTTTTHTATSVWAIDPAHSGVGFSVKHLMFATVKGAFRTFSGKVVLNEANVRASSIEVEIDANSIDTRQEQRDAHLRSADFFDAENFPTVTFRSTRIEQVRPGHFRATGELTIRGVTREVVLDVEETGRGQDPWGGERIGFTARTTIERDAFGLTWNQVLEAGGFAVGNDIAITINAEVVKQ